MAKKLIFVAITACLFFLISTAAVFARPLPQEFPPQPSIGPPGTAVTWMFETPFVNGSSGFQPGESGDIFFCTQQIDVGDFTVPNITQGEINAEAAFPTLTVSFVIPGNADIGTCTVRARGRTSGFEETGTFEVTAAQVPFTGGSPRTTFPIWLVFLAGGLMITLVGAAKRTAAKTE